MGIIAGGTIFIGLPIGRLPARGAGLRALLNAITIGVLLFLLWDVLAHAVDPVDAALTAATDGRSWWPFAGLAALLFAGIAMGLIGLVAYDRWIARRPRELHVPIHGVLRLGDPASRLAFLIAVGIGLHNFSEGLAIGQSAASGQLQLAVTLVIGFALHNATEGFGITAPMAASSVRPRWRQLAILGVIGGGPTLVGTLLGSVVVNDALRAHLSAELDIDPDDVVSPWHAALASALSFFVGGALPMLTILLPAAYRIPITFAAVIVALGLTGYAAAAIGGSPRWRAAFRVVIGGAIALAATFVIGRIFHTSGV
jgi:ZIP family zinc transporter